MSFNSKQKLDVINIFASLRFEFLLIVPADRPCQTLVDQYKIQIQ